ncbi:TIGR04219 family outer membrane beta-barrel protein [Vibrio anguillarum]|uniref:TIGR04219 family outer membrane beta-barrel protein n=1 Tax=Vibrio anguillarum TaxID=55601 RepID=UPI000980372F|nr:TIGR04219 family outer membrane beta-barrel protein [Vibrio anguillarum]AQP37041.1 iron-hydroxamate ABC transporter substrate-binding protein [Vibrio anguillarum]MBF4424744.1 TIGR04219 family outer membrane beta-barrel protein [Vibrio anguillarum]
MNKPIWLALVSVAMMMSTASVQAESFYRGEVGADMWWGSTKIDNIRRDDVKTPSIHVAFEHQLPYLPNASIRYTTLEADYASFDKYDYTLYYNLLERQLMSFDAGVTFTQYSGSQYQAPDSLKYSFDKTTFNWYAYATIKIPNTQVDVIGQFDFGDSGGIKSADVLAGLQYSIPIRAGNVALRGGYRVIDLEFTELDPKTKNSFVFVDGWFLGAEFQF